MYKICLADLIEFQATKIKKFVLLKILCKKYNKKQPPSNESGCSRKTKQNYFIL